jgi:hypothetical protein
MQAEAQAGAKRLGHNEQWKHRSIGYRHASKFRDMMDLKKYTLTEANGKEVICLSKRGTHLVYRWFQEKNVRIVSSVTTSLSSHKL